MYTLLTTASLTSEMLAKLQTVPVVLYSASLTIIAVADRTLDLGSGTNQINN
jgi:hypothetical protein